MITATTSKFKMAAIWVKIGVLRLNTYSRGVILLWELQIDGSINYWFHFDYIIKIEKIETNMIKHNGIFIRFLRYPTEIK